MKRIATLIIFLLCATTLFAQMPETFSYQAVVRNASNALVTDAMVNMRVSILQGSATGNIVYVETHTASTNANGLLTVEIGGGKAEQGEFSGIDWANGPYFLKTETDPNGGCNYSVTITQQLLSVPYALYAREAANSFSGDYNDLKNKPVIPQNVGELTNDAGYITLNDLPDPAKGGSDTNDGGIVQTTSCGEIDLCELTNRLARIEAALLPTVTTNVVNNISETTVIGGGNVTNNGYTTVTGRGVCWDTEPNPTVDDNHLSNGIGTGEFTIQLTGLVPHTTYYLRAYATNSVGTAYGEEVSFTTAEEQEDTCSKILLPFSEDFENYTTSTTAATGVQPVCWELVQEDVAMTDANRPQLYYKNSFAHSGNYSLKMGNRCVYAMPALSDNIQLNQVRLEMYVRQANANYQLQVGVWENNGTFVPVALINNSTTDVEYVECDFSNYNGNGRRIAFRNVLGGGATFNYSYNYIDDIMLYISNPVGGDTLTPQDSCNILALPYIENFDSYTNTITAATGIQPDCWMLVQEDVAMTDANRPQLYYKSSFAHSGNYSLKLSNRCVYAMPALSENIELNQIRLEMYVRQANPNYQLQIGVWEDNGSFIPVALVNNSTTDVEHVECDFTSYNGNGRRIAFHNVLGGGTNYNYSYNYLDDIMLYFANPVGGDTLTPQDTLPAVIDGNAYPCPNASTVSDYDGNIYNTVQIGNQCWMRENLRTTKYSDGTPIPTNSDSTSITEPFYYNNSDSDIPLAKRGYLYNWPAAMHGATSSNSTPSGVQGICPTGWHLPSDGEFTQLMDYVGSEPDYQCDENSNNIAKALASTLGWNTSTNNCAVGNDLSANNATGFSAIPTGYFRNSSFNYVGNYAFFWTSSENESNNRNAYTRLLSNQALVMGRNSSGKDYGRSVRCLRDTIIHTGGVTPTPQDTAFQSIQNYYKSAKNKKGYALRVAMHNIIKDYTAVSYNELWNSFYTTDKRHDNNKVWDMYSDRPGATPAYYFSFGDDQCGNYSEEGDCYNREHSVPKSWFGGSTAPMYTDLFHLIPTDGYVNSKRGNLPIGKVTNATWTSTNGSKVGTSNISGYSGQVFEPIDSFKGDFARIYFYMAVCYMDNNLGLETQSNFSGGNLKPWAQQLLLQWATLDPVSQKEIDRNNAVYQIQHNRNPFIDYPALAGMIFGSDTNTTFQTSLHSIPAKADEDSILIPSHQANEPQPTYYQRNFNSDGTMGRERKQEDL